MPKAIRMCVTLADYRELILQVSQVELATFAKVGSPQICRIEKGQLPKARRLWFRYLKAYRLEKWPMEFERMARAGGAA